MIELKSWYNGYNFLNSDMYNPFDILQFIDNDFQYSNYWFATQTPTFLMKFIEKNNYFLPNLTNIKVDERYLIVLIQINEIYLSLSGRNTSHNY